MPSSTNKPALKDLNELSCWEQKPAERTSSFFPHWRLVWGMWAHTCRPVSIQWMHVWSVWVSDLTVVRSHSKGRGRACSHRVDLGSGRQSSLSDTCHTEGPLCCAGSSVAWRTHGWFYYVKWLTKGQAIVWHFGKNTHSVSFFSRRDDQNRFCVRTAGR